MKGILTCLLLCCISVVFSKTLMEGECTKPSDCGPGECCVLGMQRYSVPECRPMGMQGDNCLKDNPPTDKVLEYPNKTLHVFGVYRLFCPCSENLICERGSCSAL